MTLGTGKDKNKDNKIKNKNKSKNKNKVKGKDKKINKSKSKNKNKSKKMIRGVIMGTKTTKTAHMTKKPPKMGHKKTKRVRTSSTLLTNRYKEQRRYCRSRRLRWLQGQAIQRNAC